MNRSVLLETFSHPLQAPGALTVARSWVHPERGPVDCPAHPLLAAAAERDGFRVRTTSLTAPDPDGRPHGTVFAVSYQDPHGPVRGLAIGAHLGNPPALAYANRQITAWSSALRTRRILLLSPPAAAPAPGTPAAAVPGQSTPGGAAPPWRACGCAHQALCPAVDRAAHAIRVFQAQSVHVALVGRPVWQVPHALPLTPHEHSLLLPLTSTNAVTELDSLDPDSIAFVVAPGSSTDQVSEILTRLRARFPRVRGQHPDQWCYTMTDQLNAARSALAESDSLLLCDSGATPTTAAAVEAATEARPTVPTHRIGTLGRLRPQDVDVAAITAVDSTGTTALLDALSGLGPLSVVLRRTLSTTVATHQSRAGADARGGLAPGDCGVGPGPSV
ncbi:4-hydroxy-3-methylbut-2-enyl diphosphate reductase [Streptomyces sp. HUAS TT7]|uniref:4-hydroxy-3-methylbut-2-enyl diphosphate reductase n=1 Tax=Streptomyces sp. HUAS TT7 TaxID=3447507 RepID=UPI003F65E695